MNSPSQLNLSKVRFYSQSGEDALIWSVFQRKSNGFFIEVGAFDGRHLSNTLSFEEQGWTGICVEPTPSYFELCQANRPGSICVQAACVGPGSEPTIEFLSEPLGLLSGITANTTPNMEGRYAARNLEFPGFTKIVVPAKTLDQILDEFDLSEQLIDVLSLDTEGNELEVLKGLTSTPRIVVCEANSARAKKELEDHMFDRGYTLARWLPPNLFFALNPNDAATIRDASINIRTELTQHPLGAHVTLPVHATRTVQISADSE